MSSSPYLSKLRDAANGFSAEGAKWDFKIGGRLILESTVTSNLAVRMQKGGIPENKMRVDSVGFDVQVFRDSGELAMAVQVKRITGARATLDYIEGVGQHAGKGFRRDIERLKKTKNVERAFVVFDPFCILSGVWRGSTDIYRERLGSMCGTDIEFLTIP